jgi:nucleoside-diphosphate-sugar epimerase
MRKIVIAGGTGFIGKYVTANFEQLGYNVILIQGKKGL